MFAAPKHKSKGGCRSASESDKTAGRGGLCHGSSQVDAFRLNCKKAPSLESVCLNARLINQQRTMSKWQRQEVAIAIPNIFCSSTWILKKCGGVSERFSVQSQTEIRICSPVAVCYGGAEIRTPCRCLTMQQAENTPHTNILRQGGNQNNLSMFCCASGGKHLTKKLALKRKTLHAK